jgi:hypothetical protein
MACKETLSYGLSKVCEFWAARAFHVLFVCGAVLVLMLLALRLSPLPEDRHAIVPVAAAYLQQLGLQPQGEIHCREGWDVYFCDAATASYPVRLVCDRRTGCQLRE